VSDPGENRGQAPPAPRDGEVLLVISPDGMMVTARTVPPEPGGKPVSVEQVLQALAAKGVVFGIDQEAVRDLVQRAERGGRAEAVVALGKRPVDGQDGAIIRHPALQGPSGSPRLMEDGRANFFDLNMVRNVAKDTVLARRQPPTQGEPGCNVFGRPVPARPGRDVRLVAGSGTRLSPDRQAVIAQVDGHAAINSRGEVTVSPIYRVSGDVGYGTGNIDFVGTVVIYGDVTQGFTVKAGQNVEVHGGIMGGCVEAAGDVLVRYGIVGGGRSQVKAGGTVRCRFIEAAEVEAGGDVVVADGILNARVSGDRVLVTGGRGSIVGGRVRALREISARTLGSASGTVTELQVGAPPAVRAELEEIRARLAQVEERFDEAARNEKYLEQAVRGAFDRSRDLLARSKRLTAAQREQLAARAAALEAQMAPVPGACVKAFDVAYPGVRIAIGPHRYSVVDMSTNICFVLNEDDEVTLVPAY